MKNNRKNRKHLKMTMKRYCRAMVAANEVVSARPGKVFINKRLPHGAELFFRPHQSVEYIHVDLGNVPEKPIIGVECEKLTYDDIKRVVNDIRNSK